MRRDIGPECFCSNTCTVLANQRKTGTACLFISHDLGVIREVAHRCVVLKEGYVVEYDTTEKVFTDSKHPYTCRLLAAASRHE